MRLIKNPFNEMEVKKILKYVVPCCEHVRDYAWYQNDKKKTIIEVPEWKDKINKDSFLEVYNKKNPLDTNNTKNLYHYDRFELGLESYVTKIKGVLQDKYKSNVSIRGTFYYPPTGYMGWHTNCGVPGERFYISWASENKKSFFRYYDYDKDEIITDYDDKGLTVRQFKVPKSAPYFWHCVGSECDRFSFGFLVDSTVTLDFNTHKKIVDKIGDGDISDYITKLVENDESSYTKMPYSFGVERHICSNSYYGDWRVSEKCSKLHLSDIQYLLTDDKLQKISFDDIAWKGMDLPVEERRHKCRCCKGERYFSCKTYYPPIVCVNMPNPFNKKYRCIDGKHRIERMLSKNRCRSRFYVLDYADIKQYFVEYDK